MHKLTAGAATAGLIATILLAAGSQMPALSKHAKHPMKHAVKHAKMHAAKHAAKPGKHAMKPMAKHPAAAAKPVAKPAEDNTALLAKGKEITAKCGCHGPDLNGRGDRSPSLHQSGVLGKYTAETFVRLFKDGLNEEGKPVGPPMSNIKLSADDSKAVYAYLKTL